MQYEYISGKAWDLIKESTLKDGLQGLKGLMSRIDIPSESWFVRLLVHDTESIRYKGRSYPLWIMLASIGVEYDTLVWLFTPTITTPFSNYGCGIDINEECNGITALAIAVAIAPIDRANHVVFNLLRLGADPTQYCSIDFLPIKVTPLHLSAKRRDIQSMQLLIMAGANVNALTSKGISPLRMSSNQRVKALLLNAGATT